jgi:hypothetical protein
MNLLNAIGSLFVYRSPDPIDSYRSYLATKSNRELREIAHTPSHYSKTMLINMIIDGENSKD